jgi:hypothetical protein
MTYDKPALAIVTRTAAAKVLNMPARIPDDDAIPIASVTLDSPGPMA